MSQSTCTRFVGIATAVSNANKRLVVEDLRNIDEEFAV
jgi:hypothetical protein